MNKIALVSERKVVWKMSEYGLNQSIDSSWLEEDFYGVYGTFSLYLPRHEYLKC